MGVFLRWGVFGILAVAALVYAYNASKGLASRHAPAQVVGSQPAEALEEEGEVGDEADPVPEESSLELPPACEEELQVAERALKMRRDGEPLDRLLRMDRIAFQNDEKRRERLGSVARHWFEREGPDPDAVTLHAEVLRDCRNAAAVSPAP